MKVISKVARIFKMATVNDWNGEEIPSQLFFQIEVAFYITQFC